MWNDDLEHAAPAEPLQALDRPIVLAALVGEQGTADVRLNRLRKCREAPDDPIQKIGWSTAAAFSLMM